MFNVENFQLDSRCPHPKYLTLLILLTTRCTQRAQLLRASFTHTKSSTHIFEKHLRSFTPTALGPGVRGQERSSIAYKVSWKSESQPKLYCALYSPVSQSRRSPPPIYLHARHVPHITKRHLAYLPTSTFSLPACCESARLAAHLCRVPQQRYSQSQCTVLLPSDSPLRRPFPAPHAGFVPRLCSSRLNYLLSQV